MRARPPAPTVAVAVLITRFRRIALAKAEGLACRRDRELHQKLGEAIRELQRRGQPGSLALKLLLEDSSPHVRRWVAPHLLSAGDPASREVLLRDSALPGTCGEEARMALRDCQAGWLTSPFGAGETSPMLPPLVTQRPLVPARERTAVYFVSPGQKRDRPPNRRTFSPEIAREMAIRPR